MITCFPSVFPDELVYSWFAKFRIHTGCYGFATAAQLLYGRKLLHPSEEFINTVTDEALSIITRNMTMSDIILKHTMFPYYGRFVPKDRRNNAFDILCKNGGYSKPILPIPVKREQKRYMRFCPICSAEGQELYSESYWHRIHQMPRIRICPIHYCQLVESNIEISSRPSPGLFTAEECIKETEIIYSENEVERDLASYVMKVFLSDMDLDNEILIGDYIQAKLEWTKHVAMCSSKIRIERFADEVNAYYMKAMGEEVGVPDHFRRLLENKRVNTHEICMIAMYLGIPAEELVRMQLPNESREQRLSKEIYQLKTQGCNYKEIAEDLGLSYDATKMIARRNMESWPSIKKIGVWEKIDTEKLRCVKAELRRLRYDSNSRPVRITRKMVANMLGIDKQHMNKVNEHTLEFSGLYETPEQFWARKLAWAFQQCYNGEQFPYWCELRTVAGIDKEQGVRCLPYLKGMLDKSKYDWTCTILMADNRTDMSPKAEKAKKIIKQHSKHFDGNMTNVAVMGLAGISKASFNRYRKELLEEEKLLAEEQH